MIHFQTKNCEYKNWLTFLRLQLDSQVITSLILVSVLSDVMGDEYENDLGYRKERSEWDE